MMPVRDPNVLLPVRRQWNCRVLLSPCTVFLKTHRCADYQTGSDDYLGCFADAEDRDLGYERIEMSEGTVVAATARCRAHCHNYPYFGLQHTNECFCGTRYGTHGATTGCVHCGTNSGNANCGGKNAVFRTYSSAKKHVLCAGFCIHYLQTSNVRCSHCSLRWLLQ